MKWELKKYKKKVQTPGTWEVSFIILLISIKKENVLENVLYIARLRIYIVSLIYYSVQQHKILLWIIEIMLTLHCNADFMAQLSLK